MFVVLAGRQSQQLLKHWKELLASTLFVSKIYPLSKFTEPLQKRLFDEHLRLIHL